MLNDNYWELINQYRTMGFDPLRWIPSCSNEIDPHIFWTAVQGIRKNSVKISPSWFDAFYYMDGKTQELTRRVYSFENAILDKEVEIKRALALFRIHTRYGDDANLLSEALQNFLKNFRTKLSVAKSTVVLTEHMDAQFALFDYIETHRGDKVGYTVATTSATSVTDVTQSPDSEIHTNIAMTAAIENLNLLGCTGSSFKIFPIYDAPTEEMLDRIRVNLDSFASRYNFAMEDYSSLKLGKLFYGTTATANSLKELPIKYDLVEEGMEILLTNKFGGLASLSLYMLTKMDPVNISKLEQNGITVSDVTDAKDAALKSLSEPHFSLGKIIAKYCPDFGSTYDKQTHIAAVYPVLSLGLFALRYLAELTNSHLVINELPVKHEQIAKFATKEFLVENATSSTNGCHLVVASKEVTSLIVEDLRKHNFDPTRIGFVAKKGSPVVVIEKDPSQYVSSKVKLVALNTLSGQVNQQ